jgi:hypothetical protein
MTKNTKHAPRRTIGDDPLDALIPAAGQAVPKAGREKSKPETSRPAPEPEPQPRKGAKIRATFHLPEDLFDEARDAVVHLAGPPERLTLAALAENALRRELERLKASHTKGKPFPRREGNLRGGRPVGS